MGSEWPGLGSESLDMSEKPNLESERSSFGSEWADLGSERPVRSSLGSEWPNLGSERPYLGSCGPKRCNLGFSNLIWVSATYS